MASTDGESIDAGSAPDLAANVRYFFFALMLLEFVVEITSSFAAKSFSLGLTYVVLSLTLSTAAGLCGALLGFVFGIPRALADGDSGAAGGGEKKSRPNTNLEQISDWLTKILVGATLTSIASVPAWAESLISYFDHGEFRDLPGGGTLAVTLIALFAALGFFWSYIETRTFLTYLFDTYGTVSADLLLKVRSAPWEPGSPPIPEDSMVLHWDGAKLSTMAVLEARAAAETRAGNYNAAIGFYRRALALDPANPRIQTRLSVLLASAGKATDADAVISRLQRASINNPARQNELEVNKVYNALYKPPPKGFQEAIEIGERLLTTDQALNGSLHLWLACAYGQRAEATKPKDRAIASNDPDRELALAQLREAVRLSPNLLPQARALWHPKEFGGNDGDNDLEIFGDDPDFKALLEAGTPSQPDRP